METTMETNYNGSYEIITGYTLGLDGLWHDRLVSSLNNYQYHAGLGGLPICMVCGISKGLSNDSSNFRVYSRSAPPNLKHSGKDPEP